jgi:hypothetical protein
MHPFFKQSQSLLKPAQTVLDIGPGIRPQELLQTEKHICIEPFEEYANVLRRRGFEVIEKTAIEGIAEAPEVDTILLLDVIEHMEKPDGVILLDACKKKARQQIVVFTPLGFLAQDYVEGEKDAWGMNGGKWQEHKSGWMPEDFPSWQILIDGNFHSRLNHGAFFAIWNA